MDVRPVFALAEELIPLAGPVLAEFGEVVPMTDLRATAAIIRSTQRVDDVFLADRPHLRHLATASSGQDHINTDLLADAGVSMYAARGCNAEAVADWVEIALTQMRMRPRRLGIVGLGFTGRAVARRFPCEQRWCDPPRAASEPGFHHVPLAELLATSDVVTLHVPLTSTTHHLIDAARVGAFAGTTLLNASRGSVLDPVAALLFASRGGALALDVFPGEPNVCPRLLAATRFATPHIAGHTDQAKTRALRMCVGWLLAQLGMEPTQSPAYPSVAGDPSRLLQSAERGLRAGEAFKPLRARHLRPVLSGAER